MKKSFCELILVYFPKIFEVGNLYTTCIANCVFNGFLSYTAIMLNIVTIHAIRKTPSLPRTLKTLLLSLAVFDVGVGLFVQPFYSSLLVKWIQQMVPNCNTYKTFSVIGILFSSASFLGVVAVSVDRFLAIHLHLRYQELVTHKRVVAVVISIWVLSTFVSLTMLGTPSSTSTLIMCILVVGLLLTTMVYIRIYLAARRHKNQIQVLQVQQVTQAKEITNFASLMKSAVGVFYVYVVFLICYLPYVIGLAVFEIVGSSITLKKLHVSFLTIVFLNSSLNPVIYCWKMRHIRHAVMNILRKKSRHRSRASNETLALAGHTMPWFRGRRCSQRLMYKTTTADSLRCRKISEIAFKLGNVIL